MGFQVSPRAEADIEAIAHQIHADNPAAAQRWLDNLYVSFSRLGEMPGMGVHRPEIGKRVRLFPFGSYGDCQDFRVRAAIMDPMEVPDGTTQSPTHS